MKAPPQGIGPFHIEPRRGLSHHASPVSLLILGAVIALGLSGWLGSPVADHTEATGAAARLGVELPAVVSTGDIFEMRLHVHAQQDIESLNIEVAPALWRQVTVNTLMPAPESEGFRNGYFRFGFGRLAAGEELLLKVGLQNNPQLSGLQAGSIRVLDGDRLLVEDARRMRVMP